MIILAIILSMTAFDLRHLRQGSSLTDQFIGSFGLSFRSIVRTSFPCSSEKRLPNFNRDALPIMVIHPTFLVRPIQCDGPPIALLQDPLPAMTRLHSDAAISEQGRPRSDATRARCSSQPCAMSSTSIDLSHLAKSIPRIMGIHCVRPRLFCTAKSEVLTGIKWFGHCSVRRLTRFCPLILPIPIEPVFGSWTSQSCYVVDGHRASKM